MKLTNKQISEIAELLDTGLICFIHQPTGKIDYHPDPLDPYFDPEPWQETMDKIEENWDDYERIDKMDSHSAFQVMEEFADSINEQRFKERLHIILSRPKPFANFKAEVETSPYRKDWFDFKKESYIDWVKKQIEK
jgi:hypothetical protein